MSAEQQAVSKDGRRIKISLAEVVRCDDCDRVLDAGETAVLRPGGEPPAIICCEACARRRDAHDATDAG